jgi:hypothetical protein
VSDYETVVALDLRPLVEWCLAPDRRVDDLTDHEWYGLLQRLSWHLTTATTEISNDEWETFSRAYDLALRNAAIDELDGIARRLHVMSAALRSAEPRSRVPLVDPEGAAGVFLGVVPMTVEEARASAEDWQSLPIADIRLLRKIKNTLTPLIAVRQFISNPQVAARVDEWAAIRDQLP